MTENQEERLVMAFERMACTIEDWFLKQYPPPREVSDATISHIKTEEDKILEEQGYERGELGRWLDIGPRERAFEENQQSSGIRSRSVRSDTGQTRD